MIEIKDCKAFSSFLGSILKISPACKLDIDSESCKVFTSPDGGVNIKAYFTIKSVTSTEPVSICIKDLAILYKGLETIQKYSEKTNTFNMEFKDGILTYTSNATNIKIVSVKQEIVQKYVVAPITSQLDNLFGFITNTKSLKGIINIQGLCSSEQPKIYLSKVGDSIKAEIDDKTKKLVNSISIPLATKDNIFGEWTRQICINMQVFEYYTCIDTDSIKISMCNKPVLKIEASKDDMSMVMISTILK